jgi:tetratricopeptide (TPR) repeat protein
VTYDTLLKSERKLGHGAAARWLQARTQGRGAEFLAMTGEHAERAGDTALAIDCFEQAGKDAQSRFANEAAGAWLRRALTLLDDSDPQRRFALLQRMENIGETVGNRSAQDAAQAAMAVLLEQHPDDALQARLLVLRGLLAERRSDWAASEQHLRQAVALAENKADAWAATRACHLLSFVLARAGELTEALPLAERSVSWAAQIAEQLEREASEQSSSANLALVLYYLCRYEEAGRINQRVLEWAEARGSLKAQHMALIGLIATASDLGRFDQMLMWSQRLLTVARSMGAVNVIGVALYSLGEAAAALGDTAAAISWYGQALPAFRAAENLRKEALLLYGMGRAHWNGGDAAAALDWHQQAHAVFQAMGPSIDADDNAACAALCQTRLGQHAAALATVNALLGRLDGELAQEQAVAKISLRWVCHQVLDAMADVRTAALLEHLHTEVQDCATKVTVATDRDRLIHAIPTFRAIVAAWSAAAAKRST